MRVYFVSFFLTVSHVCKFFNFKQVPTLSPPFPNASINCGIYSVLKSRQGYQTTDEETFEEELMFDELFIFDDELVLLCLCWSFLLESLRLLVISWYSRSL